MYFPANVDTISVWKERGIRLEEMYLINHKLPP